MYLHSAIFAFISLASISASQNPASIPMNTRDHWCNMQKAACPLICNQLNTTDSPPRKNRCDPVSLEFSCVCSNGLSPNATKYSQTIPFFLCTERNNKCVANCDDTSCKSACRQQNPCGAQNPDRVSTTSSNVAPTASSTNSGSPDTVPTPLGESSQPGRLAMEVGRVYGLGIMVTGFLAGFTLFL